MSESEWLKVIFVMVYTLGLSYTAHVVRRWAAEPGGALYWIAVLVALLIWPVMLPIMSIVTMLYDFVFHSEEERGIK